MKYRPFIITIDLYFWVSENRLKETWSTQSLKSLQSLNLNIGSCIQYIMYYRGNMRPVVRC